jgi:cytochrome c553
MLSGLGLAQAHAEQPGSDNRAGEAGQLTPSDDEGARLYAAHCARCHGNEAWGNGPAGTPSLAGQRESYLVSKLSQFASREQVHSQMHRVLLLEQRNLQDAQAWRDLAAHISSLPRNPAPQSGDGKNVERGAALHAQRCARCHEKPAGEAGSAVPEVRGQHYSYLRLRLTNFVISHPGDLDPAMAELAKRLTSEDTDALADFLSREPGGLAR